MSAEPDKALTDAADWIKSEATTATRPGQMASLDRLADVVEEGAYRLATVTARAEAAEAKVARVEAMLAAWDAWDGSPGPDGRMHPDSSSPHDRDRLRAALAPAPTEDANGRQTGSDERAGTKEDA